MANGNGQQEKGTALAHIRRAAQLSPERWGDERINAVVSMFAGNAKSPGQAAVFLAVADKYDLAPEMGEIWLGEIRGRPTVLVGRDAYLKIAKKDPGYMGFTADVVREKDEFVVEHQTRGEGGEITTIHHKKPGFERGKIVGAYALVFHADRRPVYIEKHMDELGHLTGKDVWRQNPSEMVLTRALTLALKLQFNITGVYSPADEITEEDLDDIASRKVAGESDQQLEQLKARMEKVRARVEEERAAVAEDADYEIVEQERAEAEAPQQEAPLAPPPAEAAPSEYDQARAEFFAIAGRAFASDAVRKQWQEEYFAEKPNAAHWSTDDYQRAAAMLADGIGLDPLEDDRPMPWDQGSAGDLSTL